jgi:hypothetical protein
MIEPAGGSTGGSLPKEGRRERPVFRSLRYIGCQRHAPAPERQSQVLPFAPQVRPGATHRADELLHLPDRALVPLRDGRAVDSLPAHDAEGLQIGG